MVRPDPVSLGAKAAIAWWGLGFLWDLVCPAEQTLSHAFARGLRDPHTRLPVAAMLVLIIAHLVALAAQQQEEHP